jgi:hypothetical protein
MLCAHTVRRLKPGTYDAFVAAFRPEDGEMPAGWVRFHALRGRGTDEVITFGFFDGTIEELEASQATGGYEERRAEANAYVDEVVLNGIYDVAESWTLEGAAA